MVAALSIGTELKRFKKGRMPKVALIAIILMPLLYGAMYLWAFWNPFGEVQHMPIALVNSDRGVVVDGTAINAGTQITDELLAGKELGWELVSPEEALDGVKHGRYYFALEIPAGFSAAVASPTTNDPRQAKLEVVYNDANNYLSTVIGQNAMNQVQIAVSAKISAQAVDQVLVGLQTAGGGIEQAADGAHQLSDGAVQLDDGAKQLDAGLNTAEAGSAALADGAGTLASGLDTAEAGSAALADGAGTLATGLDTASAGASTLSSGLGQLNGGAAQLGAGAAAISGGVDTLVGTLDPIAQAQQEALTSVQQVSNLLRANPDPISQQAVASLDRLAGALSTQGFNQTAVGQLVQLRDGARQLAAELGDPASQFRSGLTQAGAGADQLSSGLTQLSAGGHELDAGAASLHDGLTQLSAGGHELDAGAASLHDGLTQLAAGGQTLTDGTGQLRSGAGELATKLTEGADSVPKWNDPERLKVASTIGAPVALSAMSLTHAPTFGTGFAPFFLPLALFVGAIIIWMLMRPLQTRALSTRLSSLRVVLASYWPALWIVIAQVAVMFLVVRYAVGLHPEHSLGMVAFLLLIAAMNLALVQAFNVVLGVSVGRVVTLAFLMVQLVSSGGVYPVQTTAKPFQILHPVNPMSYAVNGLRQLILGGVDHRLWIAIAVLAGVLVAALAASALAVRRDRRWSVERLHPPLKV